LRTHRPWPADDDSPLKQTIAGLTSLRVESERLACCRINDKNVVSVAELHDKHVELLLVDGVPSKNLDVLRL
jgi:hypothetical protein